MIITHDNEQNDDAPGLESSFKCRSIVAEVLDFGVSQDEILKIIKLLALELEHRETMLKVCEAVDSSEV